MAGLLATLLNMVRPAERELSPMESQIHGAMATQQIQNPDLPDVKLKPMGGFEQAQIRHQQAGNGFTTGRHWALLPWQNTITYDADAMERAQAAGSDITPHKLIAHELQHAKQRQDRGWWQYLKDALVEEPKHAYGLGPLESEAFDAEHQLFRTVRDRDIHLSSDRERMAEELERRRRR